MRIKFGGVGCLCIAGMNSSILSVGTEMLCNAAVLVGLFKEPVAGFSSVDLRRPGGAGGVYWPARPHSQGGKPALFAGFSL